MLGISFIVQVIVARKSKRDISQDLQRLAIMRLLAKRVVRVKGRDKEKIKKLAYNVLYLTKEEKLSNLIDDPKVWIKYYTNTAIEIGHFLDELTLVIQEPKNEFKDRIEDAWALWMEVDGGREIGEENRKKS